MSFSFRDLFKSRYVKLLEEERLRLISELQYAKGQIHRLEMAALTHKYPAQIVKDASDPTPASPKEERIQKVLENGIAGTPWMRTKTKLEREIRAKQALTDPNEPKPITPVQEELR